MINLNIFSPQYFDSLLLAHPTRRILQRRENCRRKIGQIRIHFILTKFDPLNPIRDPPPQRSPHLRRSRSQLRQSLHNIPNRIDIIDICTLDLVSVCFYFEAGLIRGDAELGQVEVVGCCLPTHCEEYGVELLGCGLFCLLVLDLGSDSRIRQPFQSNRQRSLHNINLLLPEMLQHLPHHILIKTPQIITTGHQ